MSTFYLTKNAPETKKRPDVVAGSRQVAECKFFPASDTELKALGDNIPDGYVAGWASTDTIDLYNHKVMDGAFTDSIDARGLMGPRAIKLLIGHDWDKVAGVIKVLQYRRRTWTMANGLQMTGTALWIEAQMNLNISYVRDSYEGAKMLGGLNFSVGFMLQDYEFKEDENKDEFLQINKGDLFEVSVVPFPGNEEATMDFVKDGPAGEPYTTVAGFEKHLIALGLAKCRSDARKITQAVKIAPHLFAKEGVDPVLPPSTLSAPVLDAAKLTELSALVAKMKQALAPVGK